MGVPTRRFAPCRAAGNQLTGQLARWRRGSERLDASYRVASYRPEPPVESRRLQESQIGLAKGAVWNEGVVALRERERERKENGETEEGGRGQQEGVIRGCSWGGSTINARESC